MASQVYDMLGHRALWDTVKICAEALDEARVPYAVIGGVAVCIRGYERDTTNVDLLIRPADDDRARRALTEAGLSWNSEHSELDGLLGTPVRLWLAGQVVASNASVTFPDPASRRVTENLRGIAVLKLFKLIELKVACGQANERRMHKDFADAVELIARNSRGKSFARFTDPSVEKTFHLLVKRARGPVRRDN